MLPKLKHLAVDLLISAWIVIVMVQFLVNFFYPHSGLDLSLAYWIMLVVTVITVCARAVKRLLKTKDDRHKTED